jgi:thymidylate synthase ThyX
MSRERQVYLLDPKQLSPETIAVTFAKTSRSPQSFREIAAELSDAKSASFHEKWVVGYGHASVAEHAVLHIAVENLSRLAVECLESNRLASYTEKSTRYQQWGPADFYHPPELSAIPTLQDTYQQACQQLFETYTACLQALPPALASQFHATPDETPIAWERRLRSQAVDICRFLLPAASLANVGITINARALEHAISKMLSHPLQEVHSLGEEIKQISQTTLPTLIKYANVLPNLTHLPEALPADLIFPIQQNTNIDDWCQLCHYDADGQNRILAATLYRFSNIGYAQCAQQVALASSQQKRQIASALAHQIDKHTAPIRELEYTYLTFDICIDQGAYFELKRHRMMTQTPQAFTPHLGYAMPRQIVTAGMQAPYQAAMQAAAQAYTQIATQLSPQVAAYILPNAFNRRILLQTNLRSAAHLIALRSAPNAHFSIRRLAQRMAEQITQVYPLLAPLLGCNPTETWQQIELEHFAHTKLTAFSNSL